MSFLRSLLFSCLIFAARSAIHDELPQCGLSGIYKARQSIIESPNYPDNYPPNTCWDYVIRSPYRCPTKFHIQFLEFHLESSRDCSNDYLAIGLQNVDDDMDLLCGQVIGIKKYHTPDGVLRLRFFSDASPWTTSKGFKLLVTRLACEREDLLRAPGIGNDDDDTEEVIAPSLELQLPNSNVPELFRNITREDQYKPLLLPPVFGATAAWNQPQRFPAPPAPGIGGLYLPVLQRPQQLGAQVPCTPTNSVTSTQQQLYLPAQNYITSQQQPTLRSSNLQTQTQTQVASQASIIDLDPEIAKQIAPQLSLPLQDPCCSSSFHQQRFYLSSPGFPRTAFTSLLPVQQRDCLFYLEKSAQNICRLRIEFKFFDFGQTYGGTGSKQGNIDVAIATTKDVCTEDFLEVDNERFCGCRTGYIFNTYWGLGKKAIRMRLGYSGVPSSGFLLEIYQEECSATQFVPPAQLPVQQLPNRQLNGLGVQSINSFPGYLTQQPGYPLQQPIFGTQQQLQQPQLSFPLSTQQQQQQLPLYQAGFLQPQQQAAYQPQFLNNAALAQQPQQIWSQPPLNQFPQFRQAKTLDYAKSASSQQPVTVVETNSTRKEFYYYDGDEVFMRNIPPNDEPDDIDRADLKVYAAPRNRCSFDTMNILRLSVDSLWLTRPTCYRPIRNWFSNIFG